MHSPSKMCQKYFHLCIVEQYANFSFSGHQIFVLTFHLTIPVHHEYACHSPCRFFPLSPSTASPNFTQTAHLSSNKEIRKRDNELLANQPTVPQRGVGKTPGKQPRKRDQVLINSRSYLASLNLRNDSNPTAGFFLLPYQHKRKGKISGLFPGKNSNKLKRNQIWSPRRESDAWLEYFRGRKLPFSLWHYPQLNETRDDNSVINPSQENVPKKVSFQPQHTKEMAHFRSISVRVHPTHLTKKFQSPSKIPQNLILFRLHTQPLKSANPLRQIELGSRLAKGYENIFVISGEAWTTHITSQHEGSLLGDIVTYLPSGRFQGGSEKGHRIPLLEGVLWFNGVRIIWMVEKAKC